MTLLVDVMALVRLRQRMLQGNVTWAVYTPRGIRMKQLLGWLLVAMMGAASVDAVAEDFDLDEPDRKRAKRLRQSDFEDTIVREIERGYYLKAGAGSTIYFLYHRGALKPGTTLSLAVGGDFLDKEKLSAAWEFNFGQALHNGWVYADQAAAASAGAYNPNYYFQGDIHSFSLLLTGEVSFYPVRRVGIGVRGGGGVMFTPLLMGRQAYEQVVLPQWGGQVPNVHNAPHPVVMFGPTFEYYTKLSHFSIGLDVDWLFSIGFDMGVMMQGYLKYTF